MRDPARIDRMIGKLRALWHASPDLRLGQLVENICRGSSTFQVEDSQIERRMDIAIPHGWAAMSEAVLEGHE